MNPAAFSDILVLDLSRVLAGPYCAQLLADFGAEVIKVEERAGDELRTWFPQIDGESTNFQSVNRGKQSITLDLKADEGRTVMRRLIAKADVLIHSFLPPVAERLGLDYDTVHQLNPDLVYCAISGYGTVGPLKDKPGYDLMLQAFTGVMMLTGEPGGPPVRAGLSAIDISTSMLAFGGIATALFARATGKCRGQQVRLSLLETGVALLGYHVTNYMNAGFAGSKSGSGVGHIVPYQAWLCEDGYLLAGVTNDGLWRRFCDAIEYPQLFADARFATTTGRREHREVLIPLLEERFATRTVGQWLARMDAQGVPASPIHTIDQVVTHEQVLATDMIVEIQDHRGKKINLTGIPLKMSETQGVIGCRPPKLGEHTDEVLQGKLGMSAQEVRALRERKIV